VPEPGDEQKTHHAQKIHGLRHAVTSARPPGLIGWLFKYILTQNNYATWVCQVYLCPFAVQLTLPLAGRVGDLYSQSAPCRAHQTKKGPPSRMAPSI
jgi:hypothetical protein